MTVFWFLIREGFKGLIRSKYAGAFSVIIISISLILVGFGYVGSRDTLFLVENIRAQFDVDIFLHKTASSEEIDNFAALLDSMTEVRNVHYISPEKAAVKFKKEFGEDIFDILDYNPLPSSFTINLKPIYRNLVSVEGIASILSNKPVVDEVKYRKQFLILLEKYQRIVLITVVSVFAFLALLSIILTSNSIKMTIFARREVISTMKLVGATNSFVRWPFIIEGTLQGFIGSCLASLFIYGIFYFLNNYLQTVIEYKAIVSYRYYIGIVISGSLLGLIGSRRAIRKFLK